MAKRWPPILGVTGFDGGSKPAIALATRTGRLQGGEGEQAPDQGPGACCHGDGSCDELSESDCIASGGTWQGPGTDCDPNPCGTTGACCFGNVCEVRTEVECTDAGGRYIGDGTTCDPINPCDCNCPSESFGTPFVCVDGDGNCWSGTNCDGTCTGTMGPCDQVCEGGFYRAYRDVETCCGGPDEGNVCITWIDPYTCETFQTGCDTFGCSGFDAEHVLSELYCCPSGFLPPP